MYTMWASSWLHTLHWNYYFVAICMDARTYVSIDILVPILSREYLGRKDGIHHILLPPTIAKAYQCSASPPGSARV